MTSPQQIDKALFETAVNIDEPAVRRAFLERACGGDAAQRARVEGLLSAVGAAEDFFQGAEQARAAAANETVAATGADTHSGAEVPSDGPGTCVGRYKLLEQIGEGGCGVVYLAEQREPVRRRVALKVIRVGMDTASVIARFEMERQALALMDHPNIAHVLDAGATETGRPYFVMELVHGVRITEFCDDNRLTTRERLELFIQVCHAVQHAHQKGIIHRDIKPSNVLVSVQDGQGVPKIIDFGIARAIEGRLADNIQFTAFDQFIGTPAYMSPEQAERGQDLDTRSDIYSLGVLLYELLTGRTPFDPKQLLQAGMYGMLRTLREEEPRLPSALLAKLDPAEFSAVAIRRGAEPARLMSCLRGDLDWIVLKALAKDRRLRYETVNGLVMDLRRFLGDEPILARPPGRFYLFKKLVRRNKAIFAAGAVVAATLVAGLTISSWLFVREREARQRQVRLRQEADMARAGEARLLRQSKARGNVSLAAILLSEGKLPEADALLRQTPLATIEPSLEAASVFRSLGEWNAIYGRWKESADCFSLFLQADQLDKSTTPSWGRVNWLAAGPAFLEGGDAAGYERFRQMALSRFGNTTDLVAADQLVKACLLLPADQGMLDRLQPLGELEIHSLEHANPRAGGETYANAFRAMSLGLLDYRRTNFSRALEWNQKCLGYPDTNQARTAAIHALSAMAWHQLGKPERARAELAQARELFEGPFAKESEPRGPRQGYWLDWAIARILEREATPLLGLGPPFDKTLPDW